MNVGMIGLGEMGMPMLMRLRGDGHDVTFVARRSEVIEQAKSHGALSADGFRDREIVIICVYADHQVAEVAPAALSTMPAGSTLLNHTTGSPTTIVGLSPVARERGVRLLDAALSGGPADIAAKRLTLLVGGDASVLDDVRPALASYSDPILHVGELGDGQRIKLVNNALFGAHLALAVEAERVARGLGIDPARAFEAIQHCSGSSRALQTALAAGSAERLQAAAGRFIDKDVATVEQVATELDVPLGLLGSAPVRLGDIEAIKQLKARYFRFIDTKDWVAFRDLFTDDCKHYLPEESSVPFMTNEEYLPMMESMLGDGVTTHQGFTPEIGFTSAAEAEGIWAMHDYVQVNAPNGRVSIKGWGHYYETYRKCEDGRWRISSKRNTRLRTDEVPWTLPEP